MIALKLNDKTFPEHDNYNSMEVLFVAMMVIALVF